ncbi:MAG: 4-phosphoerythronate dehydrogenase PdxB [Oleiphilus sp.]|nr:MAG: 4-phosphoerythronate dehydrogenase PdxB [Oleiphilus sp.]
MKQLRIVADENITLLENFFGEIGQIRMLPGREINARDVSEADILLVRSVTRVDESLLASSPVKFVGSCSIGVDHLDTEYLDAQGIVYANAPGSNANSVVEYVVSCLSILTETHGLNWESHRVGIVGHGNVGSLLADRLSKMGIETRAYDPLLEEQEGLSSLEEVMSCDVISLHVPLTRSGSHPTYHMFDADRLSRLKSGQVLINTSRGSVVDNQALKQKLIDDPEFAVILDVWENEPAIDAELARRVFIGSPHIAGYSFDGKVAGTEMIYQRLCQHYGLPARCKAGQFLEEPPLSKMAFTSVADPDWCLHTAIRACFDVRHDDSLLKSVLNRSEEDIAQAFDRFRKHYRCRREFPGVRIQLKQVQPELIRKFRALGFNLKT